MKSRGLAVLPSALLAVGCAAADTDTQTPVELSTAAARVVVCAEPYPRVVAFSATDQPSVLLDADHRFAGVRTWFMEPTQVKHSGSPGNRKARVVEQDERRVLMEAGPDEKTKLQVLMDVQLDEDEPVLTIRHGVRNLADTPRTLAAWGIVSVPHKGRIELDAGAAGFDGRQLVFFRDTLPDHPAFTHAPHQVVVDLQQVREKAIKLGAATPSGRTAWTGDGQRLVVSAARAAGDYPEGGANATVFASGTGGKFAWAELESVGPLTRVDPGEVVWLTQRLMIEPGSRAARQSIGSSETDAE